LSKIWAAWRKFCQATVWSGLHKITKYTWQINDVDVDLAN
jgi:hypothetical protein